MDRRKCGLFCLSLLYEGIAIFSDECKKNDSLNLFIPIYKIKEFDQLIFQIPSRTEVVCDPHASISAHCVDSVFTCAVA